MCEIHLIDPLAAYFVIWSNSGWCKEGPPLMRWQLIDPSGSCQAQDLPKACSPMFLLEVFTWNIMKEPEGLPFMFYGLVGRYAVFSFSLFVCSCWLLTSRGWTRMVKCGSASSAHSMKQMWIWCMLCSMLSALSTGGALVALDKAIHRG